MDMIWQIEIAITLFFQALGHWLTLPMQAISFLGQEEFFLVMMPAIYWCMDAGMGLRLGIMLIATNSLSCWLKVVIQWPRPYWVDHRVAALAIEPTFGMPSGHSQSAVAMWGLFAQLRGSKRWWILAIVIAGLTGLSRIYLGVHFLDQVLVGWLVGALLIWLYVRLEERLLVWVRRLSMSSLMLLSLVASLLIVALTYGLNLGARAVPQEWIVNASAAAPNTPFVPFDTGPMVAMAGVMLGLGAGAAWDWCKHGPIKMSLPWQKRILRYLLGITGLLVIYYGLKLVLPGGQDLVGMSLRYVRYTLIGLWVTAAAPAVFRRVSLI
jgi:membrane-associated phospholipid phosphatase